MVVNEYGSPTDPVMDFGDEPFEIKILNTGDVVHSMKELVDIAIDYV